MMQIIKRKYKRRPD